jgi:phosphonatase-like hydrolase
LFERFLSGIHRHYAETPPREVPGASMIFAWLRSQGVSMALNTGFETGTTQVLLNAIGWEKGTFDAVVCGDEVEAGRPSPAMILEAMRRVGNTDPATVMAVGDTVLDLQAGTAAHARWVVGVTSGAHHHAALLEAPHTHLIASVAGLRELLR